MESNDRVGVTFAQPRTRTERTELARKCCGSLGITMPMVVDQMNDLVGHLYSGMPDRLYVIDRGGRVAYKGGRGPFGFNAEEMEQSLAMLLLDQQTPPASQSLLPALDHTAAWQRLPIQPKDAERPLPAWARTLAGPLPATTAAMLRLDYLHRAKNPLDPVLRGKVRWVAAHANRCAYAQAYAAADLRRAGVAEDAIAALAGDFHELPEAEREVLSFARHLTLAADTVTDAQVARLIERHGDKQVVALVLLLAYANFQDRLLLALGTEVEPSGPLPPLDVRPDPKLTVAVPPRQSPAAATSLEIHPRVTDADWLARDFGTLQRSMEQQRARPPRIAVPAWDEVQKRLPPGTPPRAQPLGIRWSLVCLGYQPELATAWNACTRAFAQEAKQDRVFEESLFWVVTRSLNCFY